jgi:hypothetical protein
MRVFERRGLARLTASWIRNADRKDLDVLFQYSIFTDFALPEVSGSAPIY